MTIDTAQLKIPVRFDLGELPIALSQLEKLGPESVLELPFDASNAVVRLTVNGEVIAQGQLMVVGRRLGVRITPPAGLQADIEALRETEQPLPESAAQDA